MTNGPDDLAPLLERCQTGDDLAWEALVRRFQGRVYAIARTYVGGTDEATDLAQEVFIRLYRSRGRWAPAEGFVPWLIRVTRNLSVDHLRRAKARPPSEDRLADDMVELAAAGETAEEQYVAVTRKRLLARALRGLGRISREMIVLKEIQGLSLEEIATMLRIPIGTVKSRSNRARVELAREVLTLEKGEAARPAAQV